jgi:sortase A
MSLCIHSLKIYRRAEAAILRSARYSFLAAGLLALTFSSSPVARAQITRSAEISKFEKSAIANAADDGGIIGQILIPRLGLKATVAEGVSAQVLKQAAGHLPETPLPGQWGNVAVAAHRNTYFRPLRKIHLGDVILVKTADASFLYQVEFTSIVEPTDVRVLQPSGAHTLTLITCFPFNYVGLAPQRFIVRAREVRPEGADLSGPENFSSDLSVARLANKSY